MLLLLLASALALAGVSAVPAIVDVGVGWVLVAVVSVVGVGTGWVFIVAAAVFGVGIG